MKGLKLLAIVFLVAALASFASALTINLQGPTDGATTSSYKVEFIYGFSEIPDLKNCSLIINGDLVETRSSLIKYDNNKITKTLVAGEYKWQVSCYDQSDSLIESAIRTLIIDVEVDTIEGYQTIYNNNGLRSYVISPTVGQAPVYLPPMLSGEDIRVRKADTQYYIDIMRMGSGNGSYYIDLRDRPSYNITRLYIDEGVDYDFDGDKIVDVRITLDKVERVVKASLIAEPYPGSSIPGTETEEPVVEEEEPVETPVENEPEEEEPAVEEPTEEAAPVSPPAATVPAKPKVWPVAIIVILLVAGLAAVLYFSTKKAPSKKQEHHKEAKVKEVQEPEKEPPRKERDESFDVIKSTGGRRR